MAIRTLGKVLVHGCKSVLLSGGALLLSVVLFEAATVSAEEGVTARVAVLDVQRVVVESDYGKAAKEKLESEFSAKRAELQIEQKEVKTLAENIQKQSALLSPSALEAKVNAAREKEKGLIRNAEDLEEALAKRNAVLLEKLIKETDRIVAAIAKEENIDFVVEKDPRSVVYANRSLEITDRVIDALNDIDISL
jgi:outer membrane protein